MAKTKDESELRREIFARALSDFRIFCHVLVWIVPKDGVRTTLKWNPIQAKYNRQRTWRDIALKPRQIGFTTQELARDVWRFLQPGNRVLAMCQTDKDQTYLKRFSGEVQRILEGLRAAGMALDFGRESESFWTLPRQDGSLQIVESGASEAAASKKGRGGTITRFHSTECAFYEYPEHSLNALLESLPTLPDTEAVFESTPNGIGNWFHRQYVAAKSKKSSYTAHFFPWFDDPTYATALHEGEQIEPETEREQELVDRYSISPEQLKWYRGKVIEKGQDLTDQEYPSDDARCFLVSGRLYFDLGALDQMIKKTEPALPAAVADDCRFSIDEKTERRIEVIPRDDLRIWHLPEQGERYVFAVDPAEGLGDDGDWTYGGIFEQRTRRHCATLRNQLDSNAYADQVVLLGAWFNDATVAVERNKGMALIRALERIGYPAVYYDPDDNKPGIVTTETSKQVMLEELANAIREGDFHTNDYVLQTECRAFVRNPTSGKPYAPGKGRKNGASDDGIMMSAIGWRAMLVPPAPAGMRAGGERASRKSRWAY